MGIKKILAATVTAGMLLSFTPAVSMADSTGWKKEGNYWKYYSYEDGYVTNKWKQIDGKWYYFGRQSIMISGVENYVLDGKYYDFASSGECLNPEGKSSLKPGWNKVCTLDYFSELVKDYYTFDWVYYDKNGNYYTGWHFIGGSWYYFFTYIGKMASCKAGDYPEEIDSEYYWFKESGEMVTGWYYDGQYWHYARSNGTLYVKDWLTSGGKTYYFNREGRMVCDAVNYNIDGKYYSFDSSGACLNPDGTSETVSGWYKEYISEDNYAWYYYGEDGTLYTGWNKIGGKWYYFEESGRMCARTKKSIDGGLYYFKKNGEMVTGWYKHKETDDEYWVYAGSNGKLYVDRWLNSGGKWYYFTKWGMMISDAENYTIDGIDYSFDSNGVCKNPSAKSGKITGWYKRAGEYGIHVNGKIGWYYYWYYYDQNGNMYTNKWLNSGGKWYYFDKNGQMACRKNFYISSEGKTFDFDSNGVCLNPYNGRDAKFS
ncbi:hypothetical protein [Butyrivibrio sp. AE2032]|uniref:hypothetical protein n=1 Tax=Butyrivibrio sp. AE2032 TaxID=1458463 RepID=UPI0005575FD0|nr:hypothetical protein [Butyrivibrio sp. AE2032]